MNIEEILNKIYTSDLLSSEELHELTEWVCNKDDEIERLKKREKELEENLLNMVNINVEYNNTIARAIEYIKTYNIEDIPFYEIIKDDLLDILQGSNSNE